MKVSIRAGTSASNMMSCHSFSCCFRRSLCFLFFFTYNNVWFEAWRESSSSGMSLWMMRLRIEIKMSSSLSPDRPVKPSTRLRTNEILFSLSLVYSYPIKSWTNIWISEKFLVPLTNSKNLWEKSFKSMLMALERSWSWMVSWTTTPELSSPRMSAFYPFLWSTSLILISMSTISMRLGPTSSSIIYPSGPASSFFLAKDTSWKWLSALTTSS